MLAGIACAELRAVETGVQTYYRAVAPFMSAELAERGDEDFWSNLGKRYAGERVLELGCGQGRVSKLLAEAGARVTGVDLSADLLARAKGMPGVTVVQGDMRRLPFGAAFDLIAAPDDPFSHLVHRAGREETLREVAQQLAPGGTFILDALWFRPAEERRRTRPGGSRDEHESSWHGRELWTAEHWDCDGDSHTCTAEYGYELDGRPAARAEFQARYWSPDEIEALFSAAGLRIIDRLGDFNGAPWNEETSPRLIVFAEGAC